MFNVGSGELLVILLLALIVLGPEKLPDAARKIGNVVAELRRMSQGFQDEVRRAMDETTSTTSTAPGTSTTAAEPPPALEPIREAESPPTAVPEHDAEDDSAA